MNNWAVAHIFASHNNIIITVTDPTGAETIAKNSGGMSVRQQRGNSLPVQESCIVPKMLTELSEPQDCNQLRQ